MSSETEPLLEANTRSADEEHGTSPRQATANKPSSKSSRLCDLLLEHWRLWKPMYLCALFLLTLEFPSELSVAPTLRMMELAVCRQYYQEHGPEFTPDAPDDLCEIEAVQIRLTKVLALLGPLETVPGLVLAVPYGMLADAKGRKFVLALSLFGCVCSTFWARLVLSPNAFLPFWMIYTVPLWQIIGGGAVVLANLILAMIADLAPSEIRTRAFLLINLEGQVNKMVGPAVGAILMSNFGPYVTYMIGAFMISLSLPMLFLLPETGGKRTREVENETTENETTSKSFFNNMKEKLSHLRIHLRNDVLPLLRSAMLVRGIIVIVIARFVTGIGSGILQYMHVRYHWKIEMAASVVSFSAAIKIVALATIIPIVQALLVKYFQDAEKANLAIVQGSMVLDVIGIFILGLSPSPVGIFIGITISTLGFGLGASLLSFLTSLVHKNDTAVMYMIISVLGTAGEIVGIPTMQYLLSEGIHLGGGWIGLPYIVGGVFFIIATLVAFGLKTPDRSQRVHEEDMEEERE